MSFPSSLSSLVSKFRVVACHALGLFSISNSCLWAAPASPSFAKQTLSSEFLSEGVALGDFNRDGVLDLVAGPYWYAGPSFEQRHVIYPAVAFDPHEYSLSFLTFVSDFNADGWPDVMVVGWPGKDTSWWENPRDTGEAWKRHLAFEGADGESPTFLPLLPGKSPVLVCMHAGHIGFAQPDAKAPNAPWTFHAITPAGAWQQYTHGVGVGDLNGDGRLDIFDKDGWWEQPADVTGDPLWKQHAVNFGEGGAQMYAYDVNGDGRADVITSNKAHGYGLLWFEQLPEAGGNAFKRHVITSVDPTEKIAGVQFSQLHAIALADVDGDGLLDIVTGKRWWAHGPEKDPDPNGTPVLYSFLLRRNASGQVHFEPHLIDDASGVGTKIETADLNGDHRADVVVSNKRGTFVFVSQTPPNP